MFRLLRTGNYHGSFFLSYGTQIILAILDTSGLCSQLGRYEVLLARCFLTYGTFMAFDSTEFGGMTELALLVFDVDVQGHG